jgi:predicted outer membrane repeat protein
MSYPFVYVAGLAAVLSMNATSFAGSVLHVDDDAPPGGDGSTWPTAFRYLQDALGVTDDPANGVTDIRVAQGTYQPDQDEAGIVTPGDREATFQLADGVALMGGFAGLGAPDPDERDIALYVTVLSGDLAGDDGPDFANTAENSYHVVTVVGVGPDTLLDGFTVTAGNANSSGANSGGGGMSILDGSPTVSICTFHDNQAWGGGAVGASGEGHTTLDGCTLTRNVSESTGGAVIGSYHGSLTMVACTFTGNAGGSNGGAVYAQGPVLELTDCTFTDNVSDLRGGAVWNTARDWVITGCSFSGNVAEDHGGAMYTIAHSDDIVADCTFIGNSAGNWGGGLLLASSGVVSGCTFTGNDAGNGGGLYHLNGSLTATNCTFTENTAFLGGAIYAHESSELPLPDTLSEVRFESNTATFGAGAYFDGSIPMLTACTFRFNDAVLGGGVYSNIASVSLEETLLESNAATLEGGGIYNEGGQLALSGCTFRDNDAGTDGGALYTIAGAASAAACTFEDNFAWDTGGGIHNRQTSLVLTDCTFDANRTDFAGGSLFNHFVDDATITDCIFTHGSGAYGGAIYNDASQPTLTGCSFTDNTASYGWAGAIFNGNGSHPTIDRCVFGGNGEPSMHYGGAIANLDSSPLVTNCLFVANFAMSASSIYDQQSNPTVVNCTLVLNWGNSVFNEGGSSVFTSCIFWDEGFVASSGPPALLTYCIVEDGYPGVGNLDVDPLFVDPGGPDGDVYTWQDNDYRLAALSPAIDAGDNTAVPPETDIHLDGNPRFHDDPGTPDTGNPDGVNPLVDRGAYEFQGASCPWDLDGSGDVGITDFLELLAAWGTDPGGPPDFDGDGDVGILDLLALLANWGACP